MSDLNTFLFYEWVTVVHEGEWFASDVGYQADFASDKPRRSCSLKRPALDRDSEGPFPETRTTRSLDCLSTNLGSGSTGVIASFFPFNQETLDLVNSPSSKLRSSLSTTETLLYLNSLWYELFEWNSATCDFHQQNTFSAAGAVGFVESCAKGTKLYKTVQAGPIPQMHIFILILVRVRPRAWADLTFHIFVTVYLPRKSNYL
jgi:hypothetical protein